MNRKGIGAIFRSGCHGLKRGNGNLWQVLPCRGGAASCGAAGSMLHRINAVAGCVMQIVFFVSVSILLKLIPKCNRLISVEPGKREQLKQPVNLVMLFFKRKRYIIVDKIDMSIKGFCSLLHYVNSVVVELIFLQLFTSAIMGNVSITIYIINLCSSKTIMDNLSLKPFLLITTLIVNLLIE